MTESATLPPTSLRRNRWKWFLALGAVLLALGLAGATTTTFLEVTSVLVFGPLLLASSLVQLLTAFFAEKGKEKLLHFAAAGVELIFALAIMMTPPQSVGGVIVLVAALLTVGGLVRLAGSLTAKSRGRAWAAASAIIALLLAATLWSGWPAAGVWFAGLCIAVDFLCHGISWSAAALAELPPQEAPAV